jgi:cyclopropane-fatty-acyl-phospholipid synthase
MFEHMRNCGHLLERISRWLKPQGKLFVHIFAHATLQYPFETQGGDNWPGRHFFTGGLMRAADTLLWFQQNMQIQQRWRRFWMACAELFGYDNGREWMVCHYVFTPRS